MTSRYGVWGDPVIVSNSKGRFFFFHLSDPTGLNWSSDEILDRIVAQRSRRFGNGWSKGSFTGYAHPKDQDKEWACVHPETDQIALTWTQFDSYGSERPEDQSNILFSLSDKSGKRWSEPVQINQFSGDCIDDDNTTEGAVPAFGPNGEIYVAWAWDEKIWFDYSLDNGVTWQDTDVVISDQPGGWSQDIPGIMRTNGMPVTVCDVSDGANRGTVYINWTDQRNGEDDTDVFVARSEDGGKTWSEPIQVNDDKTVTHQFFSWLTIDQSTGYLYCVFYDRREHRDKLTDVYLAYSTDGGLTWTNRKISESPFKPNPLVFFGDYNHIDAVNGRIRPIWARYDSGTLSIWTALIEHEQLLPK